MRRHTREPDLSIRGDELEKHRIELERNLRNTEISLRLSTPSEDEYEDRSSIEYPRHNSGPAAFASFEIASRDHYDGDTQSHIHPWPYRMHDDEEGINPYGGGESVSTAAHHASALTLSAGLGGGRMGRRDISLSGAEYDPDRPLHEMIAGVDPKLSMFDIEPSRSRYVGDPLVVDSTAELDRMLQTGLVPQVASPLQSSSSGSDSESSHANPNPRASRPKLTDSLRRVSFSPQRPRSNPGSPRISARHLPNISQNEPTPRPKKRTDIFPSYGTPQPQVRLQPPTPINASFGHASQSQSQFTKLARGITREIEHAQRGEGSRKPDRNPFDTSPAENPSTMQQPQQQRTPARPSAMKQRTATPSANLKGKVHLPDVTGLTNAVESPMKLGADYYVYPGCPRETEARLTRTLNAVQAKLQHFEEQNGISRRRVGELERELDVCKRDVERERSRVQDRESVIVQQQRDASFLAAGRRRDKGKARAKDTSVDQEGLYQRYREAVEGQKALEALITTLRTHLTRLTAELSSHRTLLMELRELRDADLRTIKAKSAEVERLSREVERLGGEVEVLRGVVEEGLRERRGAREAEELLDPSNVAMSMDREEEVDALLEEEEDEDAAEPFDPASIAGSSHNSNQSRLEKVMTMRTDHATFGSSDPIPSRSTSPPVHAPGTSVQFIDSAEFERISAEVEERRSLEQIVRSSPRPETRRATVQDASDDEESDHESQNVRPTVPPSPPRPQSPVLNQTQRPQPSHRNQNARKHSRRVVDDTPFPQIRGGHLERLFFSAPEHNAHTCNVCSRRQRAEADVEEEPSWIPTRFRKVRQEEDEVTNDEDVRVEDNDDEGFADEDEEPRQADRNGGHHNQDANDWRLRAQRAGLPPQTVVARVIRELEDDFTHYKGIYVELAEQYKDMDPVSDVQRRNLLAKHLREVVDILEQKGDQIASLYDLLSFKDKPVEESVVPPRKPSSAPSKTRLARTVSTTAVPSTSIGRTVGAGIRRQHAAFA